VLTLVEFFLNLDFWILFVESGVGRLNTPTAGLSGAVGLGVDSSCDISMSYYARLCGTYFSVRCKTQHVDIHMILKDVDKHSTAVQVFVPP
jgi:hypothetical protein